MERILRSEEMAEIILLPIRHHSPACAGHIAGVIEQETPSVVLVEGPENANHLIPAMLSDETKAPFAIYYSYHDKAGVVSKAHGRYVCFYPFLDYSPELVAIRTANKLGIESKFIDLSYAEILQACGEDKGLQKEEERLNYDDDHYVSHSEYVAALCEKTGVEQFHEFWEKYFEINNDIHDHDKWFSNMLVHCEGSRETSSSQMLEEEGTFAREERMAKWIMHYAKKIGPSGKVVVVTGGFHTPGLKQLIYAAEGNSKALLKSDKLPVPENFFKDVMVDAVGTTASRKKLDKGEEGVFLMPYSMSEADALSGYESGMPYPGFYQKIWEAYEKYSDANKLDGNHSECNGDEQLMGACYKDATLDFLVQCGKDCRKDDSSPTTYDEICAYEMAEGLAALRGKLAPGVYELYDAVLSNYIKGEYNAFNRKAMDILGRMAAGSQVGSISEDAGLPPILQDFRKLCDQYGLYYNTSLKYEKALHFLTSEKHRQISLFLHRLQFLNTGFAIMIKGPRLWEGTDRDLIREVWKYQWSRRVDAVLIDASVYGATIEEAVNTVVSNKLRKEMNAESVSHILVQVFEMGLTNRLQHIYDKAKAIIQGDSDFYSQAKGLRHLLMLHELAKAYQSKLEVRELIEISLCRMIGLVGALVSIKDKELDVTMDAIKLMYELTMKRDLGFDSERDMLVAELKDMVEKREIHSGLNGCIHGLLYGARVEDGKQVEQVARGYLTGTYEQLRCAAPFFHGLFFSARDLVFSGDTFLEMLDAFFKKTKRDEFVEMIPELRMAFSYFTPNEIHKVASRVAMLHGAKGDGLDLLEAKRAVMPEILAYGRELDLFTTGQMQGLE